MATAIHRKTSGKQPLDNSAYSPISIEYRNQESANRKSFTIWASATCLWTHFKESYSHAYSTLANSLSAAYEKIKKVFKSVFTKNVEQQAPKTRDQDPLSCICRAVDDVNDEEDEECEQVIDLVLEVQEDMS